MIRFFLALLLLIPTTVSALTLNDLNGQCGDIRVYMTYLDSTPASTGVDDQGGYIVIDDKFLAEEDDNTVWFVFFHECGHRMAGHSKYNKPPDREKVADCYAADRFVKEFGYNELVKTLDDLLRSKTNTKQRNNRILGCSHI